MFSIPHHYPCQRLLLLCCQNYLIAWLILFVCVVSDHCHETRLATTVQCPKFTKVPGHCVVERVIAYDICAETPGCKYVLTTRNAGWHLKFPNAAMLGKDPLSDNSEWKSCELPATTRKCSIHSIPCSHLASCMVWASVQQCLH